MHNGNANELNGALLGSNSMNPWHQHTTSPRGAMFANHLSQMLVIDGSTERNFQTGYEREYGKYTFKVDMPCDGVILDIIERYRPTYDPDAIQENPETVIIYENTETYQIGIVVLQDWCSNHQYFGFRYAPGEALNQIAVGAYIRKGAVFLKSPSVTDEGGYKYGIEANVLYASMPATSEDGILISESILPKLGFATYENRSADWGSKKFALNLYGDENNYKPFPDIGDYVREDNILMAFRPFGPPEMALVEQSVKDCMQVEEDFDTTLYAEGAGGKIVDIRVYHDIKDMNHAEVHMDKQIQKYDASRRVFYRRVVDAWKKYDKLRGDALNITPEFQALVVKALKVTTEGSGQSVTTLYRKVPLDIYRIEFVIEYKIKPTVGFKLTDCHGGKGVIVQVVPENEMPVDDQGNRAEIVMDPLSIIGRTNMGRPYEQYYGASRRDTHKRLCDMLGVKPFTKRFDALATIQGLDATRVGFAWDYLMGFYAILSPVQRSWFPDLITQAKDESLAEIVERSITILLPTDNQPESEDIVLQLLEKYPAHIGPVTYRGNSGNWVTTVDPMLIGQMYFIELEKIGDDWSAVGSAKLQAQAVLSQLNKADKFSKPARYQGVRADGEAEFRLKISYVGPQFVAEIADRNNNPQVHKVMCEGILRAKNPMDIENLVDRSVHPFGGSRPVQLVHHMLECSGIRFQYIPYKEITYSMATTPEPLFA